MSSRKRQAKRSTRAAVRKVRTNSAGGEPLAPSPSSHPEEEDEGTTRRAGSYSLIGGEFATETLSGKKKRGSD
jgi:hypothetical protein